MNCNACSRRTLGPFFRSFIDSEHVLPSGARYTRRAAFPRSFSAARQLQDNAKPFGTNMLPVDNASKTGEERPAWQAEKDASKRKLNGEAWNPRKKLSPDTMEGIRHLHQTQSAKFTTPVLAQHFKVSPEAIKRILKSKWRPSDEEQEARLRRWDKRGEQIWTNLVELGVKPPKKWREMGVGRARNGEKPKWKSRSRNMVTVEDSFSNGNSEFGWTEENLIPIVDGKSATRSSHKVNMPLTDRIGV